MSSRRARLRWTPAIALAIVVGAAFAPIPLAPPSVRAADALLLEAPVQAQRFSPSVGGDAGVYDCLPAATYSALAFEQQKSVLPGPVLTFEDVRRTYRAAVTGNGSINWSVIPRVIAELTGGAVTPAIAFTPADGWKGWLRTQLGAGLPVVANIPNWLNLSPAGHPTAEAGRTDPEGHAITIVGLSDTDVTYLDPWDGGKWSLPVDLFGAAWRWHDAQDNKDVMVGLTFTPASSPGGSTPSPSVSIGVPTPTPTATATSTAPTGPAALPPAPTGATLDCTYIGGAPPDVGVHQCWVGPNTFTLRWNDSSASAAGFHVYGRVSGAQYVCTPFSKVSVPLTAWKLVATVEAGAVSWPGMTFDALVAALFRPRPGYFFLPDDVQLSVTAFDGGGESPRAAPVDFVMPGRGICGD